MTKEMHYRKELSELNNSLEAKIEEKIQELKKYLDIINQHIIISTTDPRGIITYANDAFCKISGYTLDELIGQSHNIVRHPDMPQSCFRTLWETIKSGQEWRGKIKNRTKEGDYYWVDAVIKPHFNNDGQIDSYNTIRIDITDKIKLEELTHYQEEVIQKQINIANEERDKAKEYAKAKGDFLANMSHEIRTPLNAIVGFIEILKEEVAEEKLLDYVHTIDRSSQTLLQIIEDILDFSKIESGKLAIEKIFFNPYEEFKVITELFAGKCQQKNIQLHVHIDTSLPINIKSDALRLKQVISNLISNAVKFTDSEKNIFVRIEFNESRLLVSVKDEGKGIAEDKLEHIFEEFSQEDASTTRKYGGTGLGLAISSRLVQLLGGQLEVSSELQKGSIFYFSIPLSEKEISDTELQVPEHSYDTLPHIDGVKILLVEDNRANQMLMKVIFKKHKLNFDIANDGLEAIELFKQHKYDAILMDENMPNMSGTEATKAIIQIEKEEDYIHTPIIALTANAIKGDRERFLQEGMDDYLSKPINQKQLVEKLHRWIF
jgi:PAS domain S-box-containing protein